MSKQIRYSYTLLLGLFWFINSSFLHPFYVSITSIDYKPKDKTIEIASRLFYDDLELELNKNRKDKINILQSSKDARIDSAIARYFRQHFKLQLDKKSTSLQYIGYEIDKDVAWCYFEIQATAIPKQIQLNADLLYPSFRTQSNIFHATVLEKKQSAKLDYPRSVAILNF